MSDPKDSKGTAAMCHAVCDPRIDEAEAALLEMNKTIFELPLDDSDSDIFPSPPSREEIPRQQAFSSVSEDGRGVNARCVPRCGRRISVRQQDTEETLRRAQNCRCAGKTEAN